MDAKRRPRALAAILMLAAMGTGTAESVAGQLADASEHYQDALAVVHEHSGTEVDTTCPVDADVTADDQHVKGVDHCAHTHGSAVRAPALPGAEVSVVPAPAFVDIMVRPPDAPLTRLYHPPKA